MAASGAVWGIELGQCGLKALKLRQAEDAAEVVAFEVIDHEKILSQPEANKDELIAAALKKFVEKTNVAGEKFVIGVPGQQTFARFCKLPPADPRRLGDLVRYEAEQQIPFDINDVVWDFQKFEDKDSPELEVGIFAMRKDLISKHLEYFNAVKIRPYMVQTIPSGIYNFARYENEAALKEGGALVVIDVGAQNTDLIIVETNRAWSRNIPLGGNAFTEALVRAFKLRFEKAEQLKRTAASSKYARQIFQAMRPVFAELVAEIQRSIGFYSSTHRDTELKQVLAVGNAFRLPGLQKYVENNLTIPGGVAKLEQLQRVRVGPEVDAAKFNDQILNLAAVTGLALQGLGQARITADLLPPELARLAVWKRKQWWFAGAAACAAVAAITPFAKNGLDRAALASSGSGQQAEIDRIVREAQNYSNQFGQKRLDTAPQEAEIGKISDLLAKKRIIPGIVAVIHDALPKLPSALASAQTAEAFKAAVAADRSLARRNRKQIIVENMQIEFVPDVDNHQLQVAPGFNTQGAAPAAGDNPGFVATMQVRVTYGATESEVINLLTQEYYNELRAKCQTPGLGFHIPLKDPDDVTKGWFNRNLNVVPARNAGAPAAAGAGTFAQGQGGGTQAADAAKDPVTGETTTTDWATSLSMKFKMGDAPPPPPPDPNAQPAGAASPPPGG